MLLKSLPSIVKVSTILAAVSVVLAVLIRINLTGDIKEMVAYLLVGGWALIPPLWFIYEWHRFDKGKHSFEDFKYSQELARNIWLVLVVALGVITGIEWGG